MAQRKPPQNPRRQPTRYVLQFLIILSNTDPLVWRRIQVPATYSFWDLHVAIQDAMGWLDYHLHEFRVYHPENKQVDRLGIPNEDFGDEVPCLVDWQVKIATYFTHRALLDAPPALYVYDFGDDWRHVLMFEEQFPAEAAATYPRCIAGARACPPEDCGGVPGYEEFLSAIADPGHPNHAEMVAWSGGSYDPDAFDPLRVQFDNPRKRWKKAFGE